MALIPNEGKIKRADAVKLLADQMVMLFTNVVVPAVGTVFANLTAATFSGYAPLAPAYGATAINGFGKAAFAAAVVNFAHNGGGVANTVKGWALVHTPLGGPNKILALENLAVDKVFAIAGDTLSITVSQTEDEE